MSEIHQGEILCLEKPETYILVLSRDFFNRTGMTVVCPLTECASGDALHIAVASEKYNGTALLEQLRSIDLRARHFRKISEISMNQIQDISDAVQGIFEYYPLLL